MLEFLAVIAVDACISKEPHETSVVLLDGQYATVAQSFGHTNVLVRLSEGTADACQAKYDTGNVESHVDCMWVEFSCNYELQVITPVARNCSFD